MTANALEQYRKQIEYCAECPIRINAARVQEEARVARLQAELNAQLAGYAEGRSFEHRRLEAKFERQRFWLAVRMLLLGAAMGGLLALGLMTCCQAEQIVR
jgi:hypothetical protein